MRQKECEENINPTRLNPMTVPADKPVMLVLGATGGIGSELCRQLAATDCTLVPASRAEGLPPHLIEALGGTQFLTTDVTNPAQVKQCIEEVITRHGRLDGVAHCVGSVLLKPAHSTSDAEWDETIEVNLTSAFHVLRSAVQAMRATGGSIVFVSSVAARRGLANHEAIAAAKAGLIGLTLSAAATYARHSIRVNCVAPGLVRTPLTESITSNEAALRYSTSLHALRRIGEPAEVASAIRWLLDPAQGWITGQVLGVDGGLASIQPTHN